MSETVAGQFADTLAAAGVKPVYGITELVASADKSIVALLGASPDASTAAAIAVQVLEKCFDNELTTDRWRDRLRTIIPTCGIDLKQDAAACRDIRAKTAAALELRNV